MDQRTRAVLAVGAIVGIFLLVQLGALALVEPFETAGFQAVDDPKDPTNSLVYFGAILLATGGMLAAIHFELDWLLRGFIVFAGGYLSLFVFRVVVPPLVTVSVGGAPVNVLGWAGAGLLTVALYAHPEWYVIDAAGIVMGAGGAGLFGISFGLLPALVLLVVLAVYDAISVYGTEHMLTLASGVLDLKVPVVLVVPLSLSYSFAETTGDAEAGDESDDADGAATEAGGPLDRGALFIGLGDAVIPAVLVASVAFFAPASVPAVGTVPVPALTAMVGTMAGLIVLLRMVLEGRPHAGLPLLNGGTIAGYLIGALVSGVGLVQALGLAPYV